MNCPICGHILPEKSENDEAIRTMARDRYHRDGEIEIDSNAVVSEGGDNGAYVQAWVWVGFAGTQLDKDKEEKCGAIHSDPYVVCNLPKGHEGNHSGDNPSWD